MFGAPIRVHDMTGDDLGIAHVRTPVRRVTSSSSSMGSTASSMSFPSKLQSPLYAL